MTEDSSIGRVVTDLRKRAGRLRVGERMPSSRTLMSELGVGPVTIRRAVARLVSEGVLTTRPGDGTFVAQPQRLPLGETGWQQVALGASPVDTAGLDRLLQHHSSDTLLLSGGYPDASIRPVGRVASAMARAARRPGAWDRPPVRGIPELRAWFGSETGVDPDRVLVTPGGQGALSATMRALLPAGSPVLFSVPTYPGALAVARSAGLLPVPVPVDIDGVIPELLGRAFRSTQSRLLYLQPTFANPDGHVLSTERRSEVLEIAHRAGAFVIEDDWARWLSNGPPTPPPLIHDDTDGHVILVNSLTKVTSPSLRVGAISAHGPVLERIAAMRLVDDFFVSRAIQEAAVELVTSGGWQSHLRSMASALRQRREALTAALASELPEASFERPLGGVHIWVQLPDEWNDVSISERAAANGVMVVPGRYFTIGESNRCHFRLSYGTLAPHLIREAVARLSRAVDEAVSSRPRRRTSVNRPRSRQKTSRSKALSTV